MYALIRRRSEDRKCKENGKKLCRTMMFIMPLHEYNITSKDIRNKKSLQLLHENIIIHYDVAGDLEDFNNCASHGSSKRTQVFRPTMHSVKQKCKEILSSTTKPPRFIMDDFEKEQDAFSRETVVPPNARQIYNFKVNRQNEAKDDVLCLIESLLEQSKDAKNICSPVDAHQPFLREFCLQSGGQPKFVLFLDQTLKDIERFYCNNNRNTILAFDTTFNIRRVLFHAVNVSKLKFTSSEFE